MPHALIIDDNMTISAAVQDRLTELGFDSFEQSWTEDQAVAAATHHHPDLVVIGDTLIAGSPVEAARRISQTQNTTLLAITADGTALAQRLPASTAVHGPYSLTEIEAAVDDATHDSTRIAASVAENHGF